MEVVDSGASSLQIPGYRILKKINQGGMSSVYLAIQRSVGRQVALKVMSPVLNADPIFSERFQREANIVGQLSHPNIVGIHDIGRYRSLNYIAMDFMSGGSVSECLAKGDLEPLDALNVVRQIAMALDHSHSKGYVHRDLKPDNILFREDGSAVLSDFGVARAVARTTRMTSSGMVVGTPHYMSPEQARGTAVDGRADLYSLGVVFYEMLTGAVPYQAEEAVAIAIKHLTDPIPRLPARHALYQPLIDRFLAKDPDKRFQRGLDIADAADQLVATLAGKPTHPISQLNNSTLEISSLARALALTIYGSITDQFRRGLPRWRNTLDKVPKERKEQDTIVRLRQFLAEPTKHKRPWLTSTLMMAGLLSLWGLLSIIGYQSGWKTGVESLDRAAGFTASSLIGSAEKHPTTHIKTVEGPVSTSPTTLDAGAQTPINLGTKDPVTGPEPTINSHTPTAATPILNNSEAENSQALVEAVSTISEPALSALTVISQPSDTRVRIMNIGPRYHPGIRLDPGRYDIEISKPGFTAVRQWVSIEQEDLKLEVVLKRAYFVGKKIQSKLISGGMGPPMIVVGAGSFTMGNNQRTLTSPAHQVQIQQSFAISSREITFAEYDRFAESTGNPKPSDATWGRGERPVINVSWHDAQRFVEWLSKESGQHYRLASEAEWEYAARGGNTHPFWWASSDARGKANCRRGCSSKFNRLFSISTAPVGHYPANPFGLFDTAGNVAEWVNDCYQAGYDPSNATAAPLMVSGCQVRTVRGGSMRDPSNRITSDYRKGLDQTASAKDVGIRVVMELTQ
ncbi:bifunctional serine/threonine-protein kinase/formylglycine-generating enzyme family protein [Microbulbifer sp. OS29]|uniref:non-specific serine/threonine protein kinase n=1 Tax=Microbulbifer okhotskensis TaxID=2926617 RepID=A0A9X2EJT0_9GAMM|nr:bifunctional serine/threonine-protein kinase/formylglycine-generating enzyme family protein [Microbulbifer okhotskensis]MCO1333527.1 bifunctional serine/threonine-protein kinase/formylglycine-generating enzyme family protein [Microbulbifer okhotskensis]